MKIINIAKITSFCGALALSAGSALAVTATPSSLNVETGVSQQIKLKNIRGTVSVFNPKPGIAAIAKLDATTYRVLGVSAGTITVSFKDRKTTSKVKITVTPQVTGTLSGRLLASNCFQCHGTNGTGGFDRLAGKKSSEIYSELKEFSTGQEDADGIMAAHATGFSDEQLHLIANYLSTAK